MQRVISAGCAVLCSGDDAQCIALFRRGEDLSWLVYSFPRNVWFELVADQLLGVAKLKPVNAGRVELYHFRDNSDGDLPNIKIPVE